MAYLIRLYSCAALLLFSVCLHAQIPTDKLIGFYPFSGNANDESGNGYHATTSGTLLNTDRFANTAKSYSFNGNGNYITLGSDFDVLPRTVSLWFNTANTDYSFSYGSIFQSDHPGLVYGNTGMVIKDMNGYKKLLITIAGVSDTVDILPNRWYNVAVVTDINKEILYYVDGQQVGQKYVKSYNKSVNGIDKAIVGAGRGSVNSYFKGIIDDIRIYNRKLTPTEIALIKNEGACAKKIQVIDTLIIKANLTGSNPDLYEHSILVYPNPAKDYVVIDCGPNYASISHFSLKIVNAIGQNVFVSKINKQKFNINLSTWTGAGLYLVYLVDSENNIRDVKKLILR
jgi:hypothetical protein